MSSLSLADRATIANMAPEYGATMGFFPVDAETLKYLRLSGRSEHQVKLVEEYTRAQGLFRTDETPDPMFTDTIELDLATVEPSMAGPKRPQDRVPLKLSKKMFEDALGAELEKVGTVQAKTDASRATAVSGQHVSPTLLDPRAEEQLHRHGGVPWHSAQKHDGNGRNFGGASGRHRHCGRGGKNC